MANTLKIKRGTNATIPQGQLAEPLFTTDTYDLYIGKGSGGNQRIQNYIASGTSSQFLKGDGSLDSTTYQATSEKGQNNGYASLDSGGKVPAAQLPNSIMEYKGTWDASTNTPTLADGTGNAGDVYICSVGGTVNFGAGPITFAAGDWVVYSGSVWQKSINSNAVASVNGQTGAVVLYTDDISEDGSPTNLWFTNARARTALSATSPVQYNNSTGVISILDASASQSGVVTTGTQTFAGAKTFSSDLTINSVTAGRGGGGESTSTAFGYQALYSNTYNATSNANTAIGYRALYSTVSASGEGGTNTAVGADTLYANTTGDNNTAIGVNAGRYLTTGSANTLIGMASFFLSTTGLGNTAVGYGAGQSNTSGDFNTYVGYAAAQNYTGGSNNTIIGRFAGTSTTLSGNVIIADGSGNVRFQHDGTNGKLPFLTSNGFVKTSNSDGTLSVDTNTYLTTSSASSTYLPLTGGTLTGALSGTSATFSTEITSSGSQGRFGGWATGAGYQGNALEVGVSGGSAVLIGYNRTTSLYIPLTIGGNTNQTTTIGGNTIVLQNNGVTALSIASTGAATFSSSVSATSATFSDTISATKNRSNTAGTVGLKIAPADTVVSFGFRVDSATNSLNLDNSYDNTNLFKISSTGAATFSSSVAATSATFSSTISSSTTISGRTSVPNAGTNSSPYYDDVYILGQSNNKCIIQYGNSFIDNNGTWMRFIVNSNTAQNTPITALTLRYDGAATFSSSVTATSGTFSSLTSGYVTKAGASGLLSNSFIYDGGGYGGMNNTGLGSRTFVINAANGRPLALELIEYANVHAVYIRPNVSSVNLISSNYISGGVYLPLSLSAREVVSDFVISTSGNVGIGTTSPAIKLEVASSGSNSFFRNPSSTAATTYITVVNANNTSNGLVMAHISDGTGYIGTQNSADLRFVTGDSEKMRITSGGIALIGVTSASAGLGTGGLHVEDRIAIGSGSVGTPSLHYATDTNTGIYFPAADTLGFSTGGSERMRITSGGTISQTCPTADWSFTINNTNTTNPYGLYVYHSGNDKNGTGNQFLYCVGGTTERASIRSNGGLANYSANNVNLASDIRLKKDITSLSSEWNKLKQLEVVNFKYKDSTDSTSLYGAIAQQVQRIYPELVIVTREATETEPEYYGIREQPFQWITTKVLQEAMAKIEILESELAILKNK